MRNKQGHFVQSRGVKQMAARQYRAIASGNFSKEVLNTRNDFIGYNGGCLMLLPLVLNDRNLIGVSPPYFNYYGSSWIDGKVG